MIIVTAVTMTVTKAIITPPMIATIILWWPDGLAGVSESAAAVGGDEVVINVVALYLPGPTCPLTGAANMNYCMG